MKLLTILSLSIGLLLVPSSLRSQEQNDCFMLDSEGRSISLGELCSNSEDEAVSGARSGIYIIPIKRRDAGIPVVDVVFNGNQSFEMFFDTGASATVVTTEMAQALNLQAEGVITLSTAGGLVDAPVGRVASLQAGEVTLNDVVITVAPALPLGLLGQNFFGDYDVTIKQDVVELRVR